MSEQIKQDPFEVVETRECEQCWEVKEVTIVEDGTSCCRKCAVRYQGYIIKGFEEDHKWWKLKILPNLGVDED